MSSKRFKFIWEIIPHYRADYGYNHDHLAKCFFRVFLKKVFHVNTALSKREKFFGLKNISFVQRSLLTILGVFLLSTVRAEFIVNYDANFPESHKVPFQYAVGIWNQLIDTSADDVEIQAKWEDLGVPTTIGRGRTGTNRRNFPGMTFPPDTPYYPIALANQIASSDLNNATEDIIVTLNSTVGSPVYLGIDGNTPANEVDLATTILHEIGHGMGFVTLLEYGVTAASEGSWKGTSPIFTKPLLPMVVER
ncbi:MAG TPA: hypothetical protein EYP59_05560 [Thiotrichaceae bacterium]|nr:hypothetical protein [Thiotrichaceae bacterium]